MGGLVMTSPLDEALDELFGPYPIRLSVEQVAELLGRGVRDTYRRLESRDLPFGRKEGGRWLVYKTEVRAYIKSLDAPSEPPVEAAEQSAE